MAKQFNPPNKNWKVGSVANLHGQPSNPEHFPWLPGRCIVKDPIRHRHVIPWTNATHSGWKDMVKYSEIILELLTWLYIPIYTIPMYSLYNPYIF